MIGKLNRKIYKAVIWIVSISFLLSMIAVWRPSLIGEIFTPKYAVKVGPLQFSKIHYYKLVETMYNQYAQRQNISPDQMDFYKYAVFNFLKDAGVGYIVAKRFGLVVTPVYLAKKISQEAPSLLELRNSGDIDALVRYKALENYYKWELGRRAAEKLLSNSDGISRGSAARELYFKSAKADFEYAYTEVSGFADRIGNITEKDLKAYYEDHREEFKHGEKRVVLLIGVYDYRFKSKVKVSEREALLYYWRHRSKYRHGEMVHAYHILVKNETEAENLLDRLVGFYYNLTSNATSAEEGLKKFIARFGELARKYSQDPGSAQKGGDLGWFERGRMVKPFENAAFSTEPGQLYPGIVKTGYGYHIIFVAGKRKPGYRSFEEVKVRIMDTLKEKKASRLAASYLTRAVAFAMKFSRTNTTLVMDRFPEARCALTMPFEKKMGMIPGVGGYRQAVDEIFSLKKKGQWTKTMRLGQGWFKFRLEKIIPPGHEPFEKVSYRLTNRVRNEKMKSLAVKKARALIEYARKKGLRSSAKKFNFSYRKASDVPFGGAVANATSVLSRRVFARKPGEFGGPFEDGGKVYVFYVDNITIPQEDPSRLDVRRNFEKEFGSSISKDYFNYCSRKIKVIRNEEQ